MVFSFENPQLLKQRRKRLSYRRYFTTDLMAILQGWYGNFIRFRCSRRNFALEGSDFYRCLVLWSASSLYSAANSDAVFAASYLLYHSYLRAVWRKLYWYLHGVGLHDAWLARRFNLYGTCLCFFLYGACAVYNFCFFSFLEQVPCRIFQRFECRPIHAMLLRCLLYHNLRY